MLVNDNADSRRMIESCYRRHKTTINPIIEWTDRDVWDFIVAERVPYCELYDCGFKRLGCLLCPMAGHEMRKKEAQIYPKVKGAYLRAFERMLHERMLHERRTAWRTPIEVYNWWMEFDIMPDQMSMFLESVGDEELWIGEEFT